MSLPGASELFRPTQAEPAPAAPDPAPAPTPPDGSDARPGRSESEARTTTRGSGRSRHAEKITVYLDSDELLGLEQSRLTLRARHGLAIDRGRIVREAISAAIADLEAHGADSELVRRLTQS